MTRAGAPPAIRRGSDAGQGAAARPTLSRSARLAGDTGQSATGDPTVRFRRGPRCRRRFDSEPLRESGRRLGGELRRGRERCWRPDAEPFVGRRCGPSPAGGPPASSGDAGQSDAGGPTCAAPRARPATRLRPPQAARPSARSPTGSERLRSPDGEPHGRRARRADLESLGARSGRRGPERRRPRRSSRPIVSRSASPSGEASEVAPGATGGPTLSRSASQAAGDGPAASSGDAAGCRGSSTVSLAKQGAGDRPIRGPLSEPGRRCRRDPGDSASGESASPSADGPALSRSATPSDDGPMSTSPSGDAGTSAGRPTVSRAATPATDAGRRDGRAAPRPLTPPPRARPRPPARRRAPPVVRPSVAPRPRPRAGPTTRPH